MNNGLAKFTTRHTVEDILAMLDSLGLSYTLGANFIRDCELIGVCDSRTMIEAAITFKDRPGIEHKSGTYCFTDNSGLEEYSIVVEDPRYVHLKVMEILDSNAVTLPIDIFTLDGKYQTSDNIHPTAVIEEHVSIGKTSIIHAGVVVKRGSIIGEGCIIRENTVIGGVAIGPYQAKNGEVMRYPHLGGVVLGDNVEIGCSVTIMRGIVSNTIVASDTVLGNLTNIGHGCEIDENVWMSVGGMVGGHAKIEKDCTIGLGVCIKNGITIAEKTYIGMGSVVSKDTKAKMKYFGNPARPIKVLKMDPVR